MTRIIQYLSGMSNGFFVVENSVIAVDSGSAEGEDIFREACRIAGIKPQEIVLLITTHGHVDHFININAMKKLTGAPILCHREAAPYLIEGSYPDVVARNEIGRAILERQEREGPPVAHVPKVEPDIIIGDEPYNMTDWGISGKLLYTPGHSKGCISLVLDSGEAIVGDLFASFEGNPPCPAVFVSPGADSSELFQSLKYLLSLGINTFYSGHGGPFATDTVRNCIES